MKRFVVILSAILVCAAASAQAQTKKPVAKKRPATTTASRVTQDAATDPKFFSWLHYGVDPLAPDEMISTPAGVSPTDQSQLTNIVMHSNGYELATVQLKTGMAGSFFGSPVTPLPDYFWNGIKQQFIDGTIEPFCVENGERAGDFPLSFGSKKDAQGRIQSYVRGPYPVNNTGGQICGIRVKNPLLIDSGPHKGEYVRPAVYRRCRNTTGFRAEAPPVVVVPPVVQAPPTFVVPKELPPLAPVPVVVEEHKRHFSCGPAKVYCWGPAVAAAGILAATHHHGGSKENPPPSTVGKVPYPLPPR